MSHKIFRRVLQDRLNYAEQMIEKITALPLADRDTFFANEHIYHEIATSHLDDLHKIAAARLSWVNSHPEARAEDL